MLVIKDRFEQYMLENQCKMKEIMSDVSNI